MVKVVLGVLYQEISVRKYQKYTPGACNIQNFLWEDAPSQTAIPCSLSSITIHRPWCSTWKTLAYLNWHGVSTECTLGNNKAFKLRAQNVLRALLLLSNLLL